MNLNGRNVSCGFEHCCENFHRGKNGNCISEFDDVLECWVEPDHEALINKEVK